MLSLKMGIKVSVSPLITAFQLALEQYWFELGRSTYFYFFSVVNTTLPCDSRSVESMLNHENKKLLIFQRANYKFYVDF